MHEHSPLSFLKRGSSKPPEGGAWRLDANEDNARRRWRLRHDPSGSDHPDAVRDRKKAGNSGDEAGGGVGALPSLGSRVGSGVGEEEEEEEEEEGELEVPEEVEEEDDWDLVEVPSFAPACYA